MMKRTRIIIGLIILILNINIVSAIDYNLINGAFVASDEPNTNYNTWWYFIRNVDYTALTYIELPYYDSPVILHLWKNHNYIGYNIKLYSTTSFIETTITYNNKPSYIDNGNSIQSITNNSIGAEWISYYIDNPTQYMVITLISPPSAVIFDSDDGGHIPFISTIPPINFTITGKVTFKDVNNTIYNLPNAFIYYNSTINTTSDINGDYSLSGIPNGIQTIYVQKDNAYNTLSGSVSNTSTIKDFELLFSKPFISSPSVSGNYFMGTYSHNFKTINLWENPNFVWGKYYFYDLVNTSDDKFYYKQCIYSGNNIFSCDFVPERNYSFNFVYSDMYNYNLSAYHPSLTGIRNFTTSSFYTFDNTEYVNPNEIKSISLLSQGDREQILKNGFPDFIFWLLLIIIVGMILSFGSRR